MIAHILDTINGVFIPSPHKFEDNIIGYIHYYSSKEVPFFNAVSNSKFPLFNTIYREYKVPIVDPNYKLKSVLEVPNNFLIGNIFYKVSIQDVEYYIGRCTILDSKRNEILQIALHPRIVSMRGIENSSIIYIKEGLINTPSTKLDPIEKYIKKNLKYIIKYGFVKYRNINRDITTLCKKVISPLQQEELKKHLTKYLECLCNSLSLVDVNYSKVYAKLKNKEQSEEGV